MFSLVIWTLLTILKLGASSDCCCETDLDNSFYCDDTDLKAVSQRMELLESENEILRLKLDALDMNNDKHFGKIKDAVSGICELEKQIPQIHQQEEPKWDCIATGLTTKTIISPPSPDIHHTLTTSTINSTDSPLSSSPSTKTTSSLLSSLHTLTTSTVNSTDSPLSSSPSTKTTSSLLSSLHTLTTSTVNSTDSPLSSSPSTKTTSSLLSSLHTLTTSTVNSTDSPLSSSPSTKTTSSLLSSHHTLTTSTVNSTDSPLSSSPSTKTTSSLLSSLHTLTTSTINSTNSPLSSSPSPKTTSSLLSSPHTLTTSTVNSTDSPLSSSPSTKTTSSLLSSLHTLTTSTVNSTDSPLSSSPSTKTTSSLLSSLHTLTTSTINSTDSPLSSSPSTTTASPLPSSCAEALLRSAEPKNGPQLIHIPNSNLDPFFVYCLVDPRQDGAAWTIIQRRLDGAINFYRNWNEYRRGFGNVESEFFIGLKRLHALTQSAAHELWIQMEDFENTTRWAKYSSFAVGDESDGYALNQLGAFSGDAGDSLTEHAGQKFTTYDKDNDQHPTENCAIKFTSAWWYNKCHKSHLNGQYLNGEYPKEMYAHGIDWYTWHGHYYSLKYVHMAIRPINTGKIIQF